MHIKNLNYAFQNVGADLKMKILALFYYAKNALNCHATMAHNHSRNGRGLAESVSLRTNINAVVIF